MSDNWKYILLSDLSTLFTDGDWIETKDQSSSGIRLIQTGNVGVGNFKNREDKARYISQQTFARLKCKEIFEGDCLVSRLPDPVGRSCIIPQTKEMMITAVDCTIIRFNKSVILPDFFNYYSQSNTYLNDVETKCTGATRKRISRKHLGKITIPCPSIPEQKRIVAILDNSFEGIDKAIANTEKNLANARELFESYLNTVFTQKGEGWEEKSLESLGKLQTGSTPNTSEKDNFGNFIPFIKPADFLRNGSLVYDNNGLSEKGLKGSRLIRAGSVLMVCIGATIGKTGFSNIDVATNQQINSLTPTKDISSKFIYYQMLTPTFQDKVIINSSQATLPIINKTKWGNLLVSLPRTRMEQDRIVAILDGLLRETQCLGDVYQHKLTALDELKQSILQKAFAGELTAKHKNEMKGAVA